uniref:FSD1-like protein-like n=1 Tax=Neolamprologus brichardi TaxID=32507 RepID=A0A3Q4GJW7_NEOBR
MDAQKEALRRIISTLASKNEELQNFLEAVDHTLTGLQKQLSEGKFALVSCEELLDFANQTLTINTEEEFLAVRVTMAPAFRLTTRPAASDNMSQFTVDFSTERAGLQRLHFLPVPRAPQIDASSCVVRDNAITVTWRPPGEADSGGDSSSRPIERYDLEYRKMDRDSTLRVAGEACWEKVCDIIEPQVTISGLKFDSRFIAIRVRARNKAAAGEFSEPIAIETTAYNFSFDASTAHAELKVQGDTVTWEPQGVKGHDPRLRGKENKSSATPSPNKTAASRGGRDRFAGESYTVLGDEEMTNGCHYWELRPLADWKSFSVGVAYRGSLGRFDQLGKGTGSWCLHASQWLQSSLAAKHNNRAKTLDWPLPHRIGIYCDYENGDLLFIDVDRLRLVHAFKTKFSQPLVPAFTVWCGGITIATGLQVPSFMGNFLTTNRSLSSLSP